MDPNGGKKNLFNKLSKQDCIQSLQNETFERVTLSFYKYVKLTDLEKLRDALYLKWNDLKVLGRIYLSVEGINAQLSLPKFNLEEFKTMLNNYNAFEDIKFKIALEDDGKSFYKLVIKIRDQIVADGLSFNEYDITNVGNHLTAKEWNQEIENGALIVDMRNHYESEIGKFKGAICPEVETFKEQLPIVKDLLNGKEDDTVLLYCTGGIRCEKASSYLKHHGFKNVNQLHGGIIDYVRQIKNEEIENKFLGKNFVFDERRGERVSDDIISKCHQCGDPYDTHVNCKNVNCNLLFLQCDKCKIKYQNCCSLECIEISNLPKEEQKKLRQGVENKKMYYSHKKVKLNLK
tara:strand:- start:363 stop:1403 length:1041 start_codon:yes stop_codon:yes gene_type:complete